MPCNPYKMGTKNESMVKYSLQGAISFFQLERAKYVKNY